MLTKLKLHPTITKCLFSKYEAKANVKQKKIQQVFEEWSLLVVLDFQFRYKKLVSRESICQGIQFR